MRSILNLQYRLDLAVESQRPHTKELAFAILSAEDLVARWSLVAQRCGRRWTAAQAKRREIALREALSSSREEVRA